MILKGDGYTFNVTEEQLKRMHKYLYSLADSLPDRVSHIDIDKYAEKRVMPPGSPREGIWDNNFTPYLVETMQTMSPSSPIQREIIMKGAQGGWTAAAENIVCYFMDENPADVLFMSAGEDLLERWSTRRLETAIDSFGFRHKLVAKTENNAKTRRSGDKALSKDYLGGRLDLVSARSAANMRGTDKRVLIRDEIDGVKAQLSTGEGYWLEVSYARVTSWRHLKKVMDLGTPTTYNQSEIWKAYQLGDQRKFLVPCPYCGKFQELRRGDERTNYGIKPITKAGVLVDAVYMCEFCGEDIRESHKKKMLIAGHWEPSTKSTEKYWRSRHWNSCYSPLFTFRDYWAEYERAKETPDGMRSLVNLRDGLPYKETGTRMSVTRLVGLAGIYKSGTVPEGVIFTTGAADVQRGSADDENNPPRIELEILGHGLGYRTWSIQYFRIEGEVENAFAGAWEELYQKIVNREFAFKNKDGILFNPLRFFIDSGFMTHVVYQFVARLKNVFAVKGQGSSFVPENRVRDKRRPDSDRRYKISKTVDSSKLYIIATNEYKRIMRAALLVQRKDSGKQLPMLCEFPSDYPHSYFQMLNAEEMLTDGSFDSGGRRNEAADCRVYNLCAAESYLNEQVDIVREKYKRRGFSKQEILQINKIVILEKIKKDLYAIDKKKKVE